MKKAGKKPKPPRCKIAVLTPRASLDRHYDTTRKLIAEVEGSNGLNFVLAMNFLAPLLGLRVSMCLYGWVGSDCIRRFRRKISGRRMTCKLWAKPGATRVNDWYWQKTGPEVPKKGVDGYRVTLLDLAAATGIINGLPMCSLLVISGSGPQLEIPGLPGFTDDQRDVVIGEWYAQLAEIAAGRHIKVAVDAPPGVLVAMYAKLRVLGIKLFAAKWNGEEAQALAGNSVDTMAEKLALAEEFMPEGYAIIGGNGCVLVRAPSGEAWVGCAPKPKRIYCRIGSGDRTLAGFLAAILAGKSVRSAALWACAARMAGRGVMPGKCRARHVVKCRRKSRATRVSAARSGSSQH